MTLQLLYLILQHETKPQMLFKTERLSVSQAAQLIANFLSPKGQNYLAHVIEQPNLGIPNPQYLQLNF